MLFVMYHNVHQLLYYTKNHLKKTAIYNYMTIFYKYYFLKSKIFFVSKYFITKYTINATKTPKIQPARTSPK